MRNPTAPYSEEGPIFRHFQHIECWKMGPCKLLRNQDGPLQTELFLVSGIFTVLGIRGYLWLADYPKIGGAGLHIAHMLWGGFAMMVSILLTSSFLGRRIQRVAVLVGGVGFGCFIDELGKFITDDNNYFFEPAIMLIYVVFILIYFWYTNIQPQFSLDGSGYSKEEAMANVMYILNTQMFEPMPVSTRQLLLGLLEDCDKSHSLTPTLNDYVEARAADEMAWQNLYIHSKQWLIDRYKVIAGHPSFTAMVCVLFVGQAVVQFCMFLNLVAGPYLLTMQHPVIQAAGTISKAADNVTIGWADHLRLPRTRSAVVNIIQGVSMTASSAFVFVGVGWLRKSKIRAYHWFQAAMRVQLLVTQVCVLYHSQLYAAGGVLLSFSVACGLRLMIEHEYRADCEERKKQDDSDDDFDEEDIDLESNDTTHLTNRRSPLTTRNSKLDLLRCSSREFDLAF